MSWGVLDGTLLTSLTRPRALVQRTQFTCRPPYQRPSDYRLLSQEVRGDLTFSSAIHGGWTAVGLLLLCIKRGRSGYIRDDLTGRSNYGLDSPERWKRQSASTSVGIGEAKATKRALVTKAPSGCRTLSLVWSCGCRTGMRGDSKGRSDRE